MNGFNHATGKHFNIVIQYFNRLEINKSINWENYVNAQIYILHCQVVCIVYFPLQIMYN